MVHGRKKKWSRGREGILSVKKELAQLLGCSPSHVRRLLNGKVPEVPRISHMRAGRAPHQARGGNGMAGNVEAGNRRS
jgi:hypothetical protein